MWGGGKKLIIFLRYLLFINVCTFLISYARGVKTFHFEQMTVSYRLKYIALGVIFGLLSQMILWRPKCKAHRLGRRNYELDFWKLVFTICVFLWHTDPFRNENTNIVIPLQGGPVAVHFFYVISGMLMTNSILKRDMATTECGKLAILFVIKKVRTLAWDVYAALTVFMLGYLNFIPLNQIPGTLVKVIPELFFLIRQESILTIM